MPLKTKRRERLLRMLSDDGTLTVQQAAERLNVSLPTVRRDFNDLAEANLALRVHGGLRSLDAEHMTPFAVREMSNREAKRMIARAAARFIEPHSVIFIDGGTTTLQLVEFLPAGPLRVITNSVRLASALETLNPSRGGLEVFMTGGYLVPRSGLLAGPSAQRGLVQYHADLALLSATGVCADGVFNSTEDVVEAEQTMIDRAAKAILLADHTKLGRRAMCRVCDPGALDMLITDAGSATPKEAAVLDELKAGGLTIQRAPI